MKGNRSRFLLGLLSLALFLACKESGLRGSESQIKRELLSKAPIGSSRQEVHLAARDPRVLDEGTAAAGEIAYPSGAHAGSTFVRVLLGSYGSIVKTDVVGVLYFDHDQRLVGVEIKKYREGI